MWNPLSSHHPAAQLLAASFEGYVHRERAVQVLGGRRPSPLDEVLGGYILGGIRGTVSYLSDTRRKPGAWGDATGVCVSPSAARTYIYSLDCGTQRAQLSLGVVGGLALI
jgi:hypothetical protein